MKRLNFLVLVFMVMFSVGCFDSSSPSTDAAGTPTITGAPTGSVPGKRVKSVTATNGVSASIMSASINASVMGDMDDVQRSIVIVPGVKYDVTEYNANGNANRVDFTESSGDKKYYVYTYTASGKVASRKFYTYVDGTNDTLDSTRSYAYNGSDKLGTVTSGNEVFTYAYDGSGNLSSIIETVASVNAWKRTISGNTVSLYQWNTGSSTWIASETFTYTWNAAGKPTKIETTAASGTQYYTYDADGKLIKFVQGATILDYTYEMIEGEVTSWYDAFFMSLSSPFDLF